MPELTTQIECWSCPNGHNWTIDQDPAFPKASPYDEGYTLRVVPECRATIEGLGTVQIQPGECPLCFLQGVFPVPKLSLGTDPANNAAYMSVKDPDHLDEEVKPAVDAQGKPVI